MPTHTITKTCNDGAETIGRAVVITADGADTRTIPVPISSEVAISIVTDVSQLKSFFMTSDKNVTVYQNAASGGSPAKTIVLLANQPWEWNNLSGLTNPFGSTDTTGLWVKNFSATDAAVLKIKQLVDATV